MSKLKILWLSHFVPYPPKGGAFQRSFNLIKRLGAQHELHLIALRHKATTHPASEIADAREALLQYCQSVQIEDATWATQGHGLWLKTIQSVATGSPVSVRMFRSRQVRRAVRSALSGTRFDVMHLDTISVADYLEDAGGVPTIMAHMGAESFMIRRRIAQEPSLLRRLLFRVEAVTLRAYERRMCPKVHRNVVVSDLDRDLMQEVAPNAAFSVVANGVDLEYFRPVGPRDGHTILFAGRLDQHSNRHGIIVFVERVWPIIRERYPTAVFHAVGNSPPDELLREAARDDRIKVFGFVPDVRPYFEAATVAICPVLDGGGTRIKILDAMAQAVPLVSTTVGCEGIPVVPERDVLIGDSPETFAAQIGRLFEDADLRARLAASGRRLVETTFSWDALAEQLVAQYRAVTRQSGVLSPHASQAFP